MENEIEIGVKVLTRIYLHVDGNELGTAFEVAKIVRVDPFQEGTIITYDEWVKPFDDPEKNAGRLGLARYYVSEIAEKIREAMETSLRYKQVAMDAINSQIS